MGVPVIEELALERLLETLAEASGYDFRGYKHGALQRRLQDCMRREGVESIDELAVRVAADPLLRDRLAYSLTVNKESSFFRRPEFWEAFRAHAVPQLRTYPSLKAWTPACATGEESYTLAIVLQEEGLLRKTRIYATPQHPFMLDPLRLGLYRPEQAPSAWAVVENGVAKMKPELVEQLVCSVHNLVTDGSPNEFNLILCRDVLVRFDSALQERVLKLFYASLCPFGLLALGDSDPRPGGDWEPLDGSARVYRRIG